MCNQTYLNLVCPECENEGEFEKDDNEEVYCKNCGVLSNHHTHIQLE